LANGLPSAKFPWLKPLVTPVTSTSRSRSGQAIYVLYARKFCRPISGVGVLARSRYSASIESIVVYIRSMWI